MSLLDRVNRNQPGAPAPAESPRPTTTPSTPEAPTADKASVEAPAGPRHHANPLSTRTGLGRSGMGKLSALQTQYVELRSRVHSRLVEELVDTENNTHDTVV